MRRIFTAVLIGGAVLATAAMAQGEASYMVVPKASQKFKDGPGGLYSQDLLLNHKNAQANITTRNKSGQVEQCRLGRSHVHSGW